MAAAALNKYYSFTNPFGVEWTIWYLRESYTALLCANLPLTWPLLQRIFKLKNWSQNSYGTNRYYGAHSRPGGTLSAIKSTTPWAPARRLQSDTASSQGGIRRTESEEQICDGNAALKIYQSTEITVHTTKAIELGDLGSPIKSRVSVETKETKSSDSER